MIRMIAEVESDNFDGHTRSCVSWNLPDHDYGNVTSINTILDRLGIIPKDGECFNLSVIKAAKAGIGET